MADLKTTLEHIEVAGVGDVIVTPVEQDTEAGDYVRDLRIFAVPLIEGQTGEMVLQIRLRAETQERLRVVAPQAEF